jgi:hypothetical protein
MAEVKYSFYVTSAIRDADSFGTRNSALEDALMGCYTDSFDLGDFVGDGSEEMFKGFVKQVFETVERCQYEDDEAAEQVLYEQSDDVGLCGGPCYFANVHVCIEGGDKEGTYSVDEDGNLEPL